MAWEETTTLGTRKCGFQHAIGSRKFFLVNQSETFYFKWNPRIITWVLVNVLMANLKINMVNVFIKINVHVHLGTGIITSYNSYLMSHQ